MHRAFAVALALGLGACAAQPPPAPAPLAPPAPPARPPTFAFFFAYDAPLTLGAQRDGVPYEGPAQLVFVTREQSENEPEPANPEANGGAPRPEPPAGLEPVPLEFRGGKAAVPADRLTALSTARGLRLRVGSQEIDLPQTRDTSPFVCAQQLQALQEIDACQTPLPAPDLAPDRCDSPGQHAWQALLQEQQGRFEACYSDLSDATLARLRGSSQIPDRACPRLLALAGPEPSDELGVKLEPCLRFFSGATHTRLNRAILRHKLPQAIDEARRGTSAQMHAFYQQYRAIEPAHAEEIRLLAMKKFAPVDQKTWVAVRAGLENIRLSERRYTLCDYSPDRVLVGYAEMIPPRVTWRDSEPAEESFQRVRMVMDPMWQQRYRSNPREEQIARQIVSARTGIKNVGFARGCPGGKHWYFGHEPPR